MEFPSPSNKHGGIPPPLIIHSRRGSVNPEEDAPPRLSDQTEPAAAAQQRDPLRVPPEVILKIDGGNRRAVADVRNASRRDSSLDFWNNNDSHSAMQREGPGSQEDPAWKLIGGFLDKQKAAGGEMALDMDLMNELRNAHGNSHNSHNYDGENRNYNSDFPLSKEVTVSFQARDEPSSSSGEDEVNQSIPYNRRRPSNMMGSESVHNGTIGDEGSVLRCTSIQRRFSGLGRLKTRSRLMDPPEVSEMISERFKSGPLKSGLLGRASGMLSKEDEEEDPLFDDQDLPEDDFKKAKLNLLTIIQWVSLVLIVIALACTLIVSDWRRVELRGLSLWKWEVLVLVLICGRLVSGWGIRIVVFFIERSLFMRKRILYFVYGIRRAVQNCIWLGLVLIAWNCMFDEKVDESNKFLWYVNKLMVCFVVGTSLWLLKTLIVKVLASSFHVSTFFDRIQESLFNQYIIEALSGPPVVEIRKDEEDEYRAMAEFWRLKNAGVTLPPELTPPLAYQKGTSGKGLGAGGIGLPPKPTKGVSFTISGSLHKNSQNDKGISIDELHKLNNKNVSAWNMKRLIKYVRHGALTTLDEQAWSSAQGDEASTTIMSEREAKAAGRKIFANVAKPKAKFIYLDDLLRFLREEEALQTLTIVEGSPDSERISKASLKNWVVNVFRERKALALTLNDTKTAVKKLHQMVNVIVGIVIVLICVAILDKTASRFILLAGSEAVVVTFIFGNTCKQIFEAVIFVFVIHPFDVGDRCEVDGVQMIVEEMNILTTVFLKGADNQKIIYPNVTLATQPISNFYRSPDMADSINFSVHIATPAEKIALIKQRITSYIENKSEHWNPSHYFFLLNLEFLHCIKFELYVQHRMNYQDIIERWRRRGLLIEELIKIFNELDIEYRLYPLDINVRAMPGPTSTRFPSTWLPSPRS